MLAATAKFFAIRDGVLPAHGGPILTGSFQGTVPGSRIRSTAVVASALNSANVYFTFDTGADTALMRMNTLLNGSFLVLTNPTVLEQSGIAETLHGMRHNGSDRLFYFKANALKRWNGTESANVGTAIAGAAPRSIHTAISPVDGKQRIAWYNGATKKIHYCKPNPSAPSDTEYLDSQPVQLSGNGGLVQANLMGLHFDTDGIPYLLYCRSWTEGFVSFPNPNVPDETLDNNGNGRADILDTAFGSNAAGPVSLPLAGPASSFRIRFPTIGSAVVNPSGGVQSSSANLKYTIELSADLEEWLPITSTTGVSYSYEAASGTGRIYTATLTGPSGDFSARFARIAVSRMNPPAYPY